MRRNFLAYSPPATCTCTFLVNTHTSQEKNARQKQNPVARRCRPPRLSRHESHAPLAFAHFDVEALSVALAGGKRLVEADFERTAHGIRQHTGANVTPPHEIFNLWFQGFDDVPPVVRLCAEKSGRLGLRQVLLDDANVESLGIDEVMERKRKEGKISMQTWSDIVRTYLLSRHGGVWADASLYVSKLPEEATTQPFYSCRHRVVDNFVENPSIFREANGEFESKWTSFFLASHKGDVVTSWLYDCFAQYWRVWDAGVDYFLCDMLLRLGYEEVPAVRREIDAIAVNNDGALYALRYFLQQDFDSAMWQKWGHNTLNIFKLDWRIRTGAIARKSYFGRLKEELL